MHESLHRLCIRRVRRRICRGRRRCRRDRRRHRRKSSDRRHRRKSSDAFVSVCTVVLILIASRCASLQPFRLVTTKASTSHPSAVAEQASAVAGSDRFAGAEKGFD